MKNLMLLLIVVLFTACTKKQIGTKKCPDRACTEIFASVTVKFVNGSGEGVVVKNYSAVNLRTNDTIKTSAGAAWNVAPGFYIVVDDGSTKKLSEAGDDIKVSGTDTVSNQTKTAIIKVAGGKCACHITKISGPEEIQFD